jgi:predicted lipoprotein with Yx(FWY)xxD motif
VRNPWTLAGAATGVALLIAGCGSSGTTTGTTATSTTATNAAQTTPATTSTPAASTTPAVVIVTKQGKPGTILAAGPKRLTVYLFEGDKGTTSSCTGGCAKVWPPVTTGASAIAGGSANAADIGTITRPDGSKQVTYKGHPLYFYAKDGDSGDVYGQGINSFGADWYVVAPSGNKVDES